MGRKLIDHSGEIHNGIRILSLEMKATGKATRYNCQCHCGNLFVTTFSRLSRGETKSCGCQKHQKFIHDPYTYSSYNAMVQRCTNENNDSYKKYGGIGITICDRWTEKNGVGFQNFIDDMGKRPDGLSINRINSSLIYSKDTCEWADPTIQSYDQGIRGDNPSGKTGVKFRTDRNKWMSFIYVDKKYITLYYGDSQLDAISERIKAEIKYYGFKKGARDEK